MANRCNRRSKNYIKNFLFKIITLLKSFLLNLLNKIRYIRKMVFELKIKEMKKQPLKKGFIVLSKMSPKWIFLALAVNCVIGFFILYLHHLFEKFGIHVVCITICMSLTIIIGRKYINVISLLDIEIGKKNTSENTELRTIYTCFKNYAFHRLNILFGIVIPCIFFWSIFKQNYLSFDIVGFYGIFIISITLFMSILGYVEYMWMLWLLYRIAHCKHFCYNKCNPSQTPFLIYIANITNYAKWFFLVESFIYIFEYFILIPRENLSIKEIQMPDNLSFIITWIFLLIVLVLAFPVIVILQETLMTRIIDNLKQEQIQVLSLCFNITNKYLSNETIEQAYMCNSMMTNIVSSSDYPIKAQRFGPALISVATFMLHTANLLSLLPQIHNLISQF